MLLLSKAVKNCVCVKILDQFLSKIQLSEDPRVLSPSANPFRTGHGVPAVLEFRVEEAYRITL